MKFKRITHSVLTLAFLAGMSVTYTGCHREANELAHHHHDHGHEHGEEHEDEGGHHHDNEAEESEKSNHEGVDKPIVISPEHAAELGIEVTKIEPGDFFSTVTVSGELSAAPSDQSVVTARSSGIVTLAKGITAGAHVSRGEAIASVSGKGMAGGDANEAARVALTAAKRELDRVTPLHKDGIVSTRDYNAVLQTYETAKAAAGNAGSAAGSVATTPTAGMITRLLVNEGEYVDAGSPIATISGNSRLTLKADLPERHLKFLPTVTGARFRTSYSDEIFDISDYNGKRSSDIQSGVAVNGYIPVYFTLTNDGTLSGGSYCEVFLTGARRDDVISVPLTALSEQQGEYFVYVRLDEDCYEKRNVRLGASQGDAVEIVAGLKPGEEAVTAGTTFVRLAESSGVVPEGHSHNH